MKMQANLNDNNAKQCKKWNLIYERKYESKLIWKCKDEAWKSWMQ